MSTMVTLGGMKLKEDLNQKRMLIPPQDNICLYLYDVVPMIIQFFI